MHNTQRMNAKDNKKVEVLKTDDTNMVTMALRTLRLTKSIPIAEQQVLNEEKCRRIYTLSEVAEHDGTGDNDCWIVLYDRVYNVTEFMNQVIFFFLVHFINAIDIWGDKARVTHLFS